jgi:hypothetical protein
MWRCRIAASFRLSAVAVQKFHTQDCANVVIASDAFSVAVYRRPIAFPVAASNERHRFTVAISADLLR